MSGTIVFVHAQSSDWKSDEKLVTMFRFAIAKKSLKVSPDNRHVVYVEQNAPAKFSVVIDGKAEKQYDGVGYGCPIYSPDSRHLAYSATLNNKRFLVYDGIEEEDRYEGISDIVFSKDSKHLSFTALLENSKVAIVNDMYAREEL